MKRSLLLFSLLPLFALAQSPQLSKWSVGVMVSPDAYLKSSESNGNISLHDFSIGLTTQRNLGMWLTLKLGLQHSRADYVAFNDCGDCGNVPNPYICWKMLNLQERGINIPLLLRLDGFRRRLSPHIDAGLTLVHNAVTHADGSGSNLTIQQSTIAHGLIGLGVNHDLSERVNLSITPTLRHSFFDWRGVPPSNLMFSLIVELTYRLPRKSN